MKPCSALLGYLQPLFLFCLLFNQVEECLGAEQTQKTVDLHTTQKTLYSSPRLSIGLHLSHTVKTMAV